MSIPSVQAVYYAIYSTACCSVEILLNSDVPLFANQACDGRKSAEGWQATNCVCFRN